MQTTLRLDDALYKRAKVEAARQGITLTRFIEEALQLRLQQRPATGPINLPVVKSGKPFNHSPEELKRLAQESDWGGSL